MGTRGALGFRLDGVDKITYNHSDSYPSGLGLDLLNELVGLNLDTVRENVRKIILVNSADPPTEQQISENQQWANLGVSEQTLEDWYCLLRETQGTILPHANGTLGVMIDSTKFMADSLFCEWAYILNLDDGVLEVYRGFNDDPQKPGRYAALKRKETDEYYGVVLLDTVPLDQLVGIESADDSLIAHWDKLAYPEDYEEDEAEA